MRGYVANELCAFVWRYSFYIKIFLNQVSKIRLLLNKGILH